MAINVFFDDVHVGDILPAWSRKTDFMNWNRYAAVNDEFVYIHMDDEAGRAALNEQGAFGMGNLRYAYILNALRDWAGDEAEIREVGCQFRAINQKNDVLTVTGTVKEKKVEDGENRVYLDVNVVNQAGSATCPGHAVVVLPNRVDWRARSMVGNTERTP
jgi:acyl dehydratase